MYIIALRLCFDQVAVRFLTSFNIRFLTQDFSLRFYCSFDYLIGKSLRSCAIMAVITSKQGSFLLLLFELISVVDRLHFSNKIHVRASGNSLVLAILENFLLG